MQTVGFPNMPVIAGPYNGATFCNIPRCIEQNVEWVSDCPGYMREHNYQHIRPTPEAEDEWTGHVAETATTTLLPTADLVYGG